MGIHETRIREGLVSYIRGLVSGKKVFCPEINILHGESRVDLAFASAEGLHLVEIKSEADSMTRFLGQVSAYELVGDFCWAVLAERHLEKLELPYFWGVIAVTAEGFVIRNLPSKNPATPLERKRRQLQLLTSDTLREVAGKLRLPTRRLNRNQLEHAIATRHSPKIPVILQSYLSWIHEQRIERLDFDIRKLLREIHETSDKNGVSIQKLQKLLTKKSQQRKRFSTYG